MCEWSGMARCEWSGMARCEWSEVAAGKGGSIVRWHGW